MISRYNHIIIGVLLIIIAGAVFFTAGGFMDASGEEPGPAFFPRVLAILLIILSTLLMFQKKNAHQEKNTISFWNIGIPFILFTAYIVSINVLGFASSTGLFTICLLIFLGVRRWWVLILTPISLAVVTTYLFEQLLNVPLPQGFFY